MGRGTHEPTVLEIDGLTAGYDSAAVIRDLDIESWTGEIVALLGANGAGKTTTLRAVSGLVHPMEGAIRFPGRTWRACSRARARSSASRTFPKSAASSSASLWPSTSGSATAASGSTRTSPTGTSRRSSGCATGAAACCPGASSRCWPSDGLSPGARRSCSSTSSASAWPRSSSRDCCRSCGYAEESGCGVVLVEQHIELALTIADRGYVLSHGEIVLRGEADELRANHELLISSYFGEHVDLFAGGSNEPFAAPETNYEKLREAIVRGEIAPNSRLVESDVVTSFEMSRGAVRNALIRLEQEGLVVREPHRGARVRQVTDVEAIEILQARAVLEGLAVRVTAERIDEAGVERLRACAGAAPGAARIGRPARRVGRERRPPHDLARAVRAQDRPAPDPRAELPDGAVPVPHDPDPGTAAGVRRPSTRRSSRR